MTVMTCEESEILLHALLDNELDAGHAREVEAHVAACPRCDVQLSQLRAVHTEMSSPQLRFSAPAGLRARVEATVPAARARVTATPYPMASRRTLLRGFALGSVLSGALAASLMITIMRSDQDQRIMGEVVTAHLRSLQVEHLTDVQTSDQHTVKPWFNGRLDVAPPVVDLTAQGFTLLGGRLDYIDGHAVAAIVYRRRNHVLNLFVAAGAGSEREVKTETVQGFTVKSWSDQGLSFRVVSDINAEELQEFVDRFQAAARQGASL
jgi:anti-sigma factor RsiW